MKPARNLTNRNLYEAEIKHMKSPGTLTAGL